MEKEYVFPQTMQAGGMAQATGGLTLRDYFAARALQGLMSNSQAMGIAGVYADTNDLTAPNVAAKTCYEMADAMLAERSKGEA